MELGLKGRTAIVCAGSSGIGFAAAQRFADEGAEVVLVARTPARLEEAAAAIEAQCGHRPRIHAADLATPAGRESVVAAVPAPDILVASPGIPQRPLRYQQLDASAWAEWFQAHFHSAIDLIHAYAPGMCERGFGRIVNISANFIKFPQVGVGQSHAARLALAGAIASLVREVAPYNVTINSVLPGLVETPALKNALTGRAESRGVPYEEVEKDVRLRCAANRLAKPEELGDLIVMLCAAQMGYLTGQNVVSDGGAYQGLF
jgi:3-oxoacyl-[acyl-carrier protein] reductase